jgi:hypothetical protein
MHRAACNAAPGIAKQIRLGKNVNDNVNVNGNRTR